MSQRPSDNALLSALDPKAGRSHDDEPDEVVLTSRDLDLVGPLGRHEITVKWAKRLVAARRADERQAREEAQEKYRADAQEALDDEFGR